MKSITICRFSSATPGDLPNNDKFSACSVGNISAVLYKILALPPVDIQRSAQQWSGEKRNCFRSEIKTFLLLGGDFSVFSLARRLLR